MRPLITLLTDFGTADGYVAEMKGVLLSLVGEITLVDVSHALAPQDVMAARFVLERYWRRYPAGTVHVVVVDPEVGSSRAALAVAADHRFLLGPDNGVLSAALVVPGAKAVCLPVPAGASSTFHGRDVFVPAAAALAVGTPIEQLGDPLPHPMIHRLPMAMRRTDGTIGGEVVHVDRFGNAVTSIAVNDLGHGAAGQPGKWAFACAGTSVPFARTYADVAPGCPVALVGSSGLVEIAIRGGSAAESMHLRRGTEVIFIPAHE